jgi:site-specific recombinase XerC
MNSSASTKQRSNRGEYYNGGVIRKLPSGRWQAELNRDYKRRRKTCETKEACKEWINAATSAASRSGTDLLKLTTPQIGDASRALQQAKGRTNLTDAVAFWLLHHPEAGEQSTLNDFFDLYYTKLRDIKRVSADHLKDTRRYCGMLLKAHGNRTLAGITTDHLQATIDTMTGVKDSTRKKARDSWRAMFNVAKNEKLIVTNPAQEILNDFTTRMPSRIQKLEQSNEIQILKPDDTRRIFRQMETDRPELVAGLALGFFAGIRTVEISRVFWNMINLEAGEIHLPAKVTKTTECRIIPLEQNAIEWFLKHPLPRKGRVLPGDKSTQAKRRYEKGRLKACKDAGVTWVPNAGRHSYGSYHSRLNSSEHKTFTAMGHDNIRTFRKHYRNTDISQAECKAYWEIRPLDSREVIPLQAEA